MQNAIPFNPGIVSQDDWLIARKQLLRREKELTRLRDEVDAARRELPWARVEKDYSFDGSDGKVTLVDLFAGRSQLIVQHFMFGPTGTRVASDARLSPITSMALWRTWNTTM